MKINQVVGLAQFLLLLAYEVSIKLSYAFVFVLSLVQLLAFTVEYILLFLRMYRFSDSNTSSCVLSEVLGTLLSLTEFVFLRGTDSRYFYYFFTSAVYF